MVFMISYLENSLWKSNFSTCPEDKGFLNFLQIQAEAGLSSKYINTLCKKTKKPSSHGYQDLMGHSDLNYTTPQPKSC